MTDGIFPEALRAAAAGLLTELERRFLRIATAESCTGGLLIGLLTEIPGASETVDPGFVTYSNAAKIDMLGVPPSLLADEGAVSAGTARAMAEGARLRSSAGLAIAVTGIAGPGGATPGKPVGLVHFAVSHAAGETLSRERRFGTRPRHEIRLASVMEALALAREALDKSEV